MKRLNFLMLPIVFYTVAFTQETEHERFRHFNIENGIAIQGYDPVAYFKVSKAVKGSPKFSEKHMGILYYFSTEDNRKAFLAEPAKYEPQYGGWCAFALGEYGKKVEVNPETFKITDGKLYLFYNAYLNNTLKSWNKNETNLKIKADKNWINLTK